ncbi:MAG: DNA circularization N-terminal domain-containing protein [Rhodanobacter sp.]
MSWQDELQQASYRGLPFAVLGGESRFGRRSVPHQYPMRDKPYVEDLGRSIRRINLTGFLIENSLVYGGGSVIGQRLAMIGAAETAGPGILVHPTLGQLTVSIPDGGLAITERWDVGRYFELGFSFIESGDRLFPSVSTATSGTLGTLADGLDSAAGSDYATSMTETVNLGLGSVTGVLSLGNAIVGTVMGVTASFAVLVGQAARDATSLINMASLLTGNYGRYVNANVTSAYQAGQANSGNSLLTINTLTAQGAEDRAAVATAATSLGLAAVALDAATVSILPPAAQTLTAALSTAIVNPGDAVRLFNTLGAFAPIISTVGTGQTSAAQQIAGTATAALLRRAAIGAITRAAASYVPSSYNDAVTTRNLVTCCIDNEILVAGDNGDDATYGALRSLRQSVVAVLAANGANLAPLKQFNFRTPLPSLTLANRIYQDGTRAEQLVDQCNPIHPAFMPTSFQALAS